MANPYIEGLGLKRAVTHDVLNDFEGDYLLNEQTTTNMMSKGTVYRFDGVDDKILPPDSADLSFGNSVADTPFAIHAKLHLNDATNQYIFSKGTGDNREYAFLFNSADKLAILLYDDTFGNNITMVSDATFTAYEGSEIDVSCIYDGSGTATGLSLYANGLPVAATAGGAGTYVAMHNQAGGGAIGTNFSDGTIFANFEIGLVEVYNFAPTAAEVKDLISGNIPFKWQYGSQTLIVPSDDCADDDTANWTDVNSALTFDTDHYVLTVTTGATAASTSDEAALTVGKEYTATVLFKDGTGAGATASINALTNAGASLAVGTPITVGAAYAKASVT